MFKTRANTVGFVLTGLKKEEVEVRAALKFAIQKYTEIKQFFFTKPKPKMCGVIKY